MYVPTRAADRGRRDGCPADAERGDDHQRPLVGVDEPGARRVGGCAHQARQQGGREQTGGPGDGVVDGRADTDVALVGGRQHRRGQRRHHEREADPEHDRGRQDVGEVVGAGIDRGQEREAEPEHDGAAGDQPTRAEPPGQATDER